MELKWKVHKWDFNPTLDELKTAGPTEFCVMDVHRGTLIASVEVRVNNLFTPGVVAATVGDDTEAAGFVTEADVTADATPLAAGLYNGTGIYLCTKYDATVSLANGKLYTTDDTIELFYTGDADPATTAGSLSVIVTYCEIE